MPPAAGHAAPRQAGEPVYLSLFGIVVMVLVILLIVWLIHR
jgi:hypothetical protein